MKSLLVRLATIVTFGITLFLIVSPFSWSAPLNMSLLLLLNLLIILSAAYFGTRGILVFWSLSLLAILSLSLRRAEFMPWPLILTGLTAFIFYTYCQRTSAFTRQFNVEINNIEEEGNVLSVELEHLRLDNSSLKIKLQRYTTLKGLSEALSLSVVLDQLIALITADTFRIVGSSDICLLYLVDKEKQELSLSGTKSLFGDAEVRLKNGDLFDRRVFKQRSPLLVRDTKKDFRFEAQEAVEQRRRMRSLIAAPLMRKNKLLGILRLDNLKPEAYDTDDLRLLDIVSNLAAVAVENTLLYQETEKLAITDGLTGLFVHRYFQERIEQEISRALWNNSQFAFLMLDIDNFKSYNDKYGHIAGDIVLRKTAQLIRRSANPGDIVARYGGEEFAVLLVDTAAKEARSTAERIRQKIDAQKFTLRRKVTEVTVSGGLAFFPAEAKVKDNLIKAADQALYQAKRKGKNRIC